MPTGCLSLPGVVRSDAKACLTLSGLPNPNFRNQGFSKKNQEFIRRKNLLNQEKNQEVFFLIFKSYYMIPSI
jgi:16S rRNA C1402 (ribose-2'-O) methylase RsmI